jgi:hypothetical protein
MDDESVDLKIVPSSYDLVHDLHLKEGKCGIRSGNAA